MKNKAQKEKGSAVFWIISKLMYAAAVIMALISIALSSRIAYDSMYYTQRLKGYSLESLDNDFSDGNYGSMCRKIAYNKACGRSVSEDEQDYYTFASFYESVIEYNVALSEKDSQKAAENLSLSNEYLSKFNHRIFKEKALELQESLSTN